MGILSQSMMTGTLRGHSPVPPAPTSKPPTPPQIRAMGTGSLTKGSREYRTPPAVAPPQVPSNYAPNFPLGHSRRERNSSVNYGTLPMPHTGTMQSQASAYNAPSPLPPQMAMVHPIPHAQPPSSIYAPGLERQRSYSNPRKFAIALLPLHLLNISFFLAPPSPAMLKMETPPSNYGTVSHVEKPRVVSMSPPPPPLPVDDDMDSAIIGRRGVLPDEEDLPGWVPKDYLEKGITLKELPVLAMSHVMLAEQIFHVFAQC